MECGQNGTEIQNTMNGSLAGNRNRPVAYYTFNDNTYNGGGQNRHQSLRRYRHRPGTRSAMEAHPCRCAFDCPNTSMPGLQSPNCAIQFDGAAKVTANGMGNMPAKGTVEFWIKPGHSVTTRLPAMFNVPPMKITDCIYHQRQRGRYSTDRQR